jgi:hypothetical protein
VRHGVIDVARVLGHTPLMMLQGPPSTARQHMTVTLAAATASRERQQPWLREHSLTLAHATGERSSLRLGWLGELGVAVEILRTGL